jgi:hypothetical protein
MRHAIARGRGRLTLALTAVAIVALTGSCSAEPASVEPAPAPSSQPDAVIAPAAMQSGEAVPAPLGDPVLTITGKIATTNSGNSLRFDAATLDRLGLLQVTVDEPWVKQKLKFQGPWLADVLKMAKVDPAARTLHVTALDDYQIDVALADVQAGGILLATKKGDGQPIPVEEGGPTRIVYLGGNLAGASADQWIWSLASIDVR